MTRVLTHTPSLPPRAPPSAPALWQGVARLPDFHKVCFAHAPCDAARFAEALRARLTDAAPPWAVELVAALLRWDPAARPSATGALAFLAERAVV